VILAVLLSTSPTSTTVASAHSIRQAEAQATLRCLQASQVPAQRLQATHQPRLGTLQLRQASAARASVPLRLATLLPVPSTRLHRRATLRHRPLTVRPLLRHIPQLHRATHRLLRRTRLPRQATALLRRRTVARPHRTTARHRPRTVRRRLPTARQARSLVRATTGARLPLQLPRPIAQLVRSTLLRALLATQRTRPHRLSSLPRHRVRHHTRRLRQSGRLLARRTRPHLRNSKGLSLPSAMRVNMFISPPDCLTKSLRRPHTADLVHQHRCVRRSFR
jgi:hypothetical protein